MNYARLLRNVVRHEGQVRVGDRHVVYDDVDGQAAHGRGHPDGAPSYLTIGFGRNLEHGISHDEAMFLLKGDLEVATDVAIEFAGDRWAELGDQRREVLIEMAFQLGKSRLFGFKRMRRELLAGNVHMTVVEMLDSKWASKDSPARANELAGLYRRGDPWAS